MDLLLQLNEPADQLCAEFLAHAETRLEEQLGILGSFQEQVIYSRPCCTAAALFIPNFLFKSSTELIFIPLIQDLLEFVDMGSKGFLSDLCLVVASYNDMFINRQTPEFQSRLVTVHVKNL